LLAAASDIIVTDIGQVALFIFTLDGLALGVNDGVLRDDAVLGRIGLDNLELDAPEMRLSMIVLDGWIIYG
jgi:hypothetical protein